MAEANQCEACERAPAQCVDACDEVDAPYQLCLACQQRLHARALRPLEWYNLVKRHGWRRFLLHDDFYDEDGTAIQPEEDVETAEAFPAPTLAGVMYDARRLLDYSITRWHFEPEVAAAWSTHTQADVLNKVSERFASTSNIQIRSRVLEICASALSEFGAGFVQYAWGDYPATVALPALAQASAACLPSHDGFSRVTAALSEQLGSRKRDFIFCLSYFHSMAALDWIEEHVFEPITEAWGNLAAASRLDWPRVECWLQHGRPLSLVALDGLAAILHPQTPFLRAYAPRLHLPPTRERLAQVLSAHAERDGVPRVQKRTATLISCASTLTNGG